MKSRVVYFSVLILSFLSMASAGEAPGFRTTGEGWTPEFSADQLVCAAVCQFGLWPGVTAFNAPVYPYPVLAATRVTQRQIRLAKSLTLPAIDHLSALQAKRLLPAFSVVEDVAALKYTNRGMYDSGQFDAAHVRTALVQEVIFRKETLPWLEIQSIYHRPHR